MRNIGTALYSMNGVSEGRPWVILEQPCTLWTASVRVDHEEYWNSLVLYERRQWGLTMRNIGTALYSMNGVNEGRPWGILEQPCTLWTASVRVDHEEYWNSLVLYERRQWGSTMRNIGTAVYSMNVVSEGRPWVILEQPCTLWTASVRVDHEEYWNSLVLYERRQWGLTMRNIGTALYSMNGVNEGRPWGILEQPCTLWTASVRVDHEEYWNSLVLYERRQWGSTIWFKGCLMYLHTRWRVYV